MENGSCRVLIISMGEVEDTNFICTIFTLWQCEHNIVSILQQCYITARVSYILNDHVDIWSTA